MKRADRASVMSLSELWLELNQFSRNLQPLNKFLWIFLAMNLSKWDEKFSK